MISIRKEINGRKSLSHEARGVILREWYSRFIESRDNCQITGYDFRIFRRFLNKTRDEMYIWINKHNKKIKSKEIIVTWELRKKDEFLPKDVSSVVVSCIIDLFEKKSKQSEQDMIQNISSVAPLSGAAIGVTAARMVGTTMGGAIAGGVLGGILGVGIASMVGTVTDTYISKTLTEKGKEDLDESDIDGLIKKLDHLKKSLS